MHSVSLEGVTKRHGRGAAAVVALDDVTVAFASGTFTAIMGPSGSGKSTLLQCAAGLDRPDAGTVEVAGVALDGLGEAARAKQQRVAIARALVTRPSVLSLLKDRVADVRALVAALHEVLDGGTVVDQEVVRRLLAEPRDRLVRLTARERETLALMAAGRSVWSIALVRWWGCVA